MHSPVVELQMFVPLVSQEQAYTEAIGELNAHNLCNTIYLPYSWLAGFRSCLVRNYHMSVHQRLLHTHTVRSLHYTYHHSGNHTLYENIT